MQESFRKTILIVDDSLVNLTVLGELLEPYYKVRASRTGENAIRIVKTQPRPDVILLDIMMPEMDGYQVLRSLRSDPETHDIPVIFVTAKDGVDSELFGLARGAVDYIIKPIVPAVLLARVQTQLELKSARDKLTYHNDRLEAEIAKRMAENELIQEVSIRALAHLAETRDTETGNHILRTQGYVEQLATRLTSHPNFASQLTEKYIKLLCKSAPLHDIGKVGIPDNILLKPGPLSPDEWEIMKTHARLGSEAIELAEQDATETVEFLSLAKEIAHWHHEKWDGSGYPDGLSGRNIPISARIMAVADVFDALISNRAYKKPFTYQKSREIIAAGRDIHFDPDIVDAFLDHFMAFCEIADRYSDDNLASIA
jgi:putative two-component system response regulator